MRGGEEMIPSGHAPAHTRGARGRPYLELFLISFLILYLELACIRWFGATVVFLTFFTNIVLMASFLGMSVGCMTAGRRANFIHWTLPLLCASVALATLTFVVYQRQNVAIGMGDSAGANPQLIYFGTEYRGGDISRFVVPLEIVAAVFFTLIALTFIGLGQVMGRAFNSIESRVGAYTVNVVGSLAGIALFAAMSWTGQAPHVWFLLAVFLCLYFARPWTGRAVVGSIVTIFLVAGSAYGVNDWDHLPGGQDGWKHLFWSPYYKIAYDAKGQTIDTNNISHQQMLPVASAGAAYMLPHLLNRDAGGTPFKDVLIIGAGSGNDLSAALRGGGRDVHVDAVEIDPEIARIGFNDHPDKPYTDGRVALYIDDGRSFLKKTDRQYDLVCYALVDSLVLHSGYSSLRLESFLFTREAMQDVKAKLKPGGVLVMYNSYRQGWVIARLTKMAQEVFGVEPIVISLPHQPQIKLADNQAAHHVTFLLVGKPLEGAAATTGPAGEARVPLLDAMRAKFAESKNFWIHSNPSVGESVNGFSPTPPNLIGQSATQTAAAKRSPWLLISPAKVETEGASVIVPTDDWPFLYLREKTIPRRPGLLGIVIIGGLSSIILLAFSWPVWFGRGGAIGDDSPRSGAGGRFNFQMFFIGAGFMLLETKGVVHMALLFGSTWIVNSIVFFAILVMILLANLFVVALRPRNVWPWYALLGVALVVGALVPMNYFLSMPPTPRIIFSCCVFFVPVFFAGVVFAASFRDSPQPDVDFGSNIAGVILGGLSEHLGLMLGFNKLLLVAVGFYCLSAMFMARRRERVDAPERFVQADQAHA